ncbi:MAG TPA: oxidoreductase [Clostridiales bacterium]|nr:oxidoreductase [Clostridiales bacterium]
MKITKVGIIGCGAISGIYLKNLTGLFRMVEVAAVADLIPERSAAKAAEFNIPRSCTPEELLADPEIEIVVNLTIPKVHAEISLAALNAGKHVYLEKPLAVNRDDGRKVIELARKKGLMVGCAPETFFGGGIQTCRKLIDDGWIGKPIAATAFMMCHGHESWHPDPEFYYKAGGGPMFDMGPYYLTALVNLLGPADSVMGCTRVTFPTRTITSAPKFGTVIDVDVPTHVAGLINYSNGAAGTIITSFDTWGARLPRIEIYGTEGTLSVPDPNSFGGPVSYLNKVKGSEWKEMPMPFGYTQNTRGIGVADMARAAASGRAHRAHGDMAFHVLDIMQGFHDSSDTGKLWKLESTCQRPAPMPMGLIDGMLD